MTGEAIRKIARRLLKVKICFEIQDRRAIDEAANTLMRLAADEDESKPRR